MMRERWMWKAVNCLYLDLAGAPLSRGNARAFQQHFEGSLPCASPSCAHPLAASREFHRGRLLPLPFSSLANDDWVRSSEPTSRSRRRQSSGRALRGSVGRASERGTRRRPKRDASHFVARREPSPASFIWIVGSGLSDCTVHAKRKDRICERTELCRVLPYRFLVYRPPAAWPVKLRLFRRSTGEQWNNKWPARPTSSGSAARRYPTSIGSSRVCSRIPRSSPGLAARCSIQVPTRMPA
jgi:hypothetical protein